MAGTLSIKKQGITEMDVDCIVNAANGQLQHGGGVCGAIFVAAGAKELQAACDIYGGCPTGDVVITPGFRLKAKYIIHAVGPIWQGGHKNEQKLLYSCYQKALKVAHCNGCRSIAFPLISSGIYGYPKDEAWRVAIKAIQDSPYNLDVAIAVIDDKALQLGTSILSEMMPKDTDNSAGFQFFWHEYDPFGEFSQWFKSPFVVEGIHYETAEQYMMAKKALLFGDLIRYSLIMNEPDPSKCKKLGQLVQTFDGKVWDGCKEEIVFNANMAKFSQNEHAKQLLLSTGDKIIAEASPFDKVWGIRMEANDPDSTNPAKWQGENLLGKALMKVRDSLKLK